MTLDRRGFLVGLGCLAAAPAIVRSEVLMPLRGVVVPTYYYRGTVYYAIMTDQLICQLDKAQFELPSAEATYCSLDAPTLENLVYKADRLIGDVAVRQQRYLSFPVRLSPSARTAEECRAEINKYVRETRFYQVSAFGQYNARENAAL